MTIPTCGTCLLFQHVPTNGATENQPGLCFRFPPVWTGSRRKAGAFMRPPVDAIDLACGEHREEHHAPAAELAPSPAAVGAPLALVFKDQQVATAHGVVTVTAAMQTAIFREYGHDRGMYRRALTAHLSQLDQALARAERTTAADIALEDAQRYVDAESLWEELEDEVDVVAHGIRTPARQQLLDTAVIDAFRAQRRRKD